MKSTKRSRKIFKRKLASFGRASYSSETRETSDVYFDVYVEVYTYRMHLNIYLEDTRKTCNVCVQYTTVLCFSYAVDCSQWGITVAAPMRYDSVTLAVIEVDFCVSLNALLKIKI